MYRRIAVVTVLVLVSVFALAADPTFDTRRIAVAGLTADDLKTADLDRDGRADLIGLTSGGIVLLFGDGTGGFSRTDLASSQPGNLQLADFNGDGSLDLAVLSNGVVQVFLNNGNRSFNARPAASVPLQVPSFAAGDFNGDSRADVAFASGKLTVSVALGNGDGTFGSPQLAYTASVPSNATDPTIWAVQGSFIAGDFNGDGRRDFAFSEGPISYAFGGVKITALLNQGGLNFSPTQFEEGNFTRPVILDANRDGRDDLGFGWQACHTPCAGGDVWAGGSTFSPLLTFDTAPGAQSTPISPVAGDFDRDGITDIAFSMVFNTGPFLFQNPLHQSVLFFRGPQPGQAWNTTSVDINIGPSDYNSFYAPMASSDFNADGRPDLAVIPEGANAILIMLNTTVGSTSSGGTPSIGMAVSPSTGTVRSGQRADFTVSMSPANGFNDTVAFSCAGLPTGAACTFSPSQMTVGGGQATSTLSITTTSSSARLRFPMPLTFPVLGLALLGMGNRKRVLFTLALLLALMAVSNACGGSNNAVPPTSNTPTGSSSTATPAGTYTVTINGDGRNSGAHQSTTIRLTVQ